MQRGDDMSEWIKCTYEDMKFNPFGEWIDGKWYIFKDCFGNVEKARMKTDAYDHFFPPTKTIKEENIIAYKNDNH